MMNNFTTPDKVGGNDKTFSIVYPNNVTAIKAMSDQVGSGAVHQFLQFFDGSGDLAYQLNEGTNQHKFLSYPVDSEQGFSINGATVVNAGRGVFANGLNILPSAVPLSPIDAGTQGDFTWNNDHIYLCIADNVWVRADLATW